jgi:hypothetical protein
MRYMLTGAVYIDVIPYLELLKNNPRIQVGHVVPPLSRLFLAIVNTPRFWCFFMYVKEACLVFFEVGEDIVIDEPSNKVELCQGCFDTFCRSRGFAVDVDRKFLTAPKDIESTLPERSEV